jgi:hypothetical protein
MDFLLDDAQAKLVGDTIRACILAVNNVAYTSQASWQLYYTAGTASDWYYGEAKIPLSYTVHISSSVPPFFLSRTIFFDSHENLEF